MTRRKSTPPEAALVAIDVAKHRNEVLIEAVRGGRRRRMTMLGGNLDRLGKLIEPFRKFEKLPLRARVRNSVGIPAQPLCLVPILSG